MTSNFAVERTACGVRSRTRYAAATMRCPICSNALEKIQVGPCFDCGHSPGELGECTRGEHEYHKFKLWGQELVLCDFCDADFGSYFPEYFGMPQGMPQDYPLELVEKIETPVICDDFYCAKCQHRLAFLTFLANVRRRNAS